MTTVQQNWDNSVGISLHDQMYANLSLVLGPIYIVSGTRDNPPPDTLAEVTFILFLSKI